MEHHNENSDPALPGALTMKCFTKGGFYSFTTGSYNSDLAFYQIEFPLTYFLESNVIHPGDDFKRLDFSSHPPTTIILPEIRSKKIR